MKHLILVFCALFSLSALAETKYESAMVKALDQYKTAKTADDMIAVSALFERIGDAEKDKWLPFYYAALSNCVSGWMNISLDKDKVAEKSRALLAKADALEKENSEILCVYNMVASLQMMVDPQSRWQTYGGEATMALEGAKKADGKNPRIYYLEGQALMYTPEAYGGGKKPALVKLQKAMELFKEFKPASELHPVWGQELTEKLIEECKK
ncbi:hypothetical protein BH11BAC2_BH11BAC2_14340 [soil metagenome]